MIKQGKGSYITCANCHVDFLFSILSNKQCNILLNLFFTTLSNKWNNKKEIISHVLTTMCIFVLFSFRQTKHHSPNFIFYNTNPQGNKQGKGSYITCANYHVHLFVLISFKQKKLSPKFIFTTLSLKGKNKEKEVT